MDVVAVTVAVANDVVVVVGGGGGGVDVGIVAAVIDSCGPSLCNTVSYVFLYHRVRQGRIG